MWACPVLYLYHAENLPFLRWTWNDGIWPWRLHWSHSCGQPDKICINIAGDGCFRMNMNELATASRYNIPIIQVVINNHVLGMVSQWQTLFYGKRYSQTVLNDRWISVWLRRGLAVKQSG